MDVTWPHAKQLAWITSHNSHQYLLKYIPSCSVTRWQLLKAEPLVWFPLPSSYLTPHLSRRHPDPFWDQSAGSFTTQSDAALNSASHPPTATFCTTRYSERHALHHTDKHTAPLTHRPRIALVNVSAPPLPHRHAPRELEKETRTTMIKTENSLSGCQCWNYR